MTTPAPSPDPAVKDRVYRSPMGILGGALLLAIALWLGIDALVIGTGRTPWLALAALILAVPLVSAFTLRPAVYANEERLRIRNPLRVVVLPWGQVASLRSRYSNEVVTASGAKFALWAVPVSLRARKKAARQTAAAERGASRGGRRGGDRGLGLGLGTPGAGAGADGPVRAETDKVMDELRELLERWEDRASRSDAPSVGEVSVRWAYEVIGPAVAGAVLLVVLLAAG
ncbi:PH domain-containing protein [Streptomyces sp. NPDC046859]|uniref:PH domain-containing protein n=1 Tax=Streptomyces sp. NPDC046859 TaxID=3155734 RepID=UPI0033F8EFDB